MHSESKGESAPKVLSEEELKVVSNDLAIEHATELFPLCQQFLFSLEGKKISLSLFSSKKISLEAGLSAANELDQKINIILQQNGLKDDPLARQYLYRDLFKNLYERKDKYHLDPPKNETDLTLTFMAEAFQILISNTSSTQSNPTLNRYIYNIIPLLNLFSLTVYPQLEHIKINPTDLENSEAFNLIKAQIANHIKTKNIDYYKNDKYLFDSGIKEAIEKDKKLEPLLALIQNFNYELFKTSGTILSQDQTLNMSIMLNEIDEQLKKMSTSTELVNKPGYVNELRNRLNSAISYFNGLMEEKPTLRIGR